MYSRIVDWNPRSARLELGATDFLILTLTTFFRTRFEMKFTASVLALLFCVNGFAATGGGSTDPNPPAEFPTAPLPPVFKTIPAKVAIYLNTIDKVNDDYAFNKVLLCKKEVTVTVYDVRNWEPTQNQQMPTMDTSVDCNVKVGQEDVKASVLLYSRVGNGLDFPAGDVIAYSAYMKLNLDQRNENIYVSPMSMTRDLNNQDMILAAWPTTQSVTCSPPTSKKTMTLKSTSAVPSGSICAPHDPKMLSAMIEFGS
jgi:hypothetical protein